MFKIHFVVGCTTYKYTGGHYTYHLNDNKKTIRLTLCIYTMTHYYTNRYKMIKIAIKLQFKNTSNDNSHWIESLPMKTH